MYNTINSKIITILKKLCDKSLTFGELQLLMSPGFKDKSISVDCIIVVSHDREE